MILVLVLVTNTFNNRYLSLALSNIHVQEPPPPPPFWTVLRGRSLNADKLYNTGSNQIDDTSTCI